MTTQRETGFERHLQTGLAVVLIGFVGWVGITVSNNAALTARLDERMIAMQEQMRNLQSEIDDRMKDRYTGQEGRLLEKRVEILEARVNKYHVSTK